MIWTVTLDRNQKPAEKQMCQIEEAAKREIVFDKDSQSLYQLWRRRSCWQRKIEIHSKR